MREKGKPLTYAEAVAEASRWNAFALGEIAKQRAASPLQKGDAFTVVDLKGQTWRVEIQDAMPYGEDGVSIMGLAKVVGDDGAAEN